MSGVHLKKVDCQWHDAATGNVRRMESAGDVLRIHRDNNIRQASRNHDEINKLHGEISALQAQIDDLRKKNEVLTDQAHHEFADAIRLIEGSDASLEPVMVTDNSEADFLAQLNRSERS